MVVARTMAAEYYCADYDVSAFESYLRDCVRSYDRDLSDGQSCADPVFHIRQPEQSQIGQNYLRSLLALGFQGFLILICVGIYAVMVQGIAFTDDVIGSIWGVMGYTVLLCFTLFKTGTLAKGVFNCH